MLILILLVVFFCCWGDRLQKILKGHSHCALYGAAKPLLSALHRRSTAPYDALRRCGAIRRTVWMPLKAPSFQIGSGWN